MTTALHPAGSPTTASPEVPPRRRRDRDTTAGISAADLLARYSEAGFDAPAPGSRRAARAAAVGPDLERIEAPTTAVPAAGDEAGAAHFGDGDTVVTRDLPAGVTARSAVGLVRGAGDTGPLGTRPRAVVATMSATLVGATAVMGVVTTMSSSEETPGEQSPGVGLAGVDNQATMKLSVPAAGPDGNGAGTSAAATSLSTGLQQATAAVPQAFQQADAARIAAVAQEEAEQRAEQARERASAAAASASRAGEGAGAGAGSGDGAGTGSVSLGPVTDAGGSAKGMQALEVAKTKLGTPYEWGATGPDAFDCSGLMVWAYEQAGVELPRTSKAQSQTEGQDVSQDELKPGDMVFFYSPVSHVGIYAGNGKVLHASTSGEPVKYSDVEDMPFHNAIRV